MAPKIINMLKQVKCTKSIQMFCLNTGKSIIVPSGTTLDRWTPDEKRIWFTYRKDKDTFEMELGIKYLSTNGTFIKCIPVFK